MIVGVNPIFQERFPRNGALFSYFKTGPVGQSLMSGHRLFFLREPSTASPNAGLFGHAIIRRVSHGRPDEVWRQHDSQGPLFSAKEYEQYTRGKDSIVGIELADFASSDPIPLAFLCTNILRAPVDSTDLGNTYLSGSQVDLCLEAMTELTSSVADGHRTGIVEPEGLTTILFVTSDPSDQTRLRVQKEYREISERLRLAQERHRFRLEVCLASRVRDLTDALARFKPSFVHFSGHGDKDGHLCFEDASGKTKPVDLSALGALFGLYSQHIKCVLLNACYVGAQADVIAKHVPFVLGMSNAVTDPGAIVFAAAFYRSIGDGEAYERAFSLATAELGIESPVDAKLPVLAKREFGV
jgi:hypothetical protein